MVRSTAATTLTVVPRLAQDRSRLLLAQEAEAALAGESDVRSDGWTDQEPDGQGPEGPQPGPGTREGIGRE